MTVEETAEVNHRGSASSLYTNTEVDFQWNKRQCGIPSLGAALGFTTLMLMDLDVTCPHIPNLWPRCESVSKLSTQCFPQTGFVLFLCPQLRWKVPGVPSRRSLRWDTATASVQYWKAVITSRAITLQWQPTLKCPCVVSPSRYHSSCSTLTEFGRIFVNSAV